ncbi:putative unusual protein kinase regulating ubiquinone biosynthesis (AarF/ABC1/UbiB family) [Nocardia transvalensis]|uniref:Putative unusual protein kinase regulating ubiquinone biosynthesis (AarF/ABC1/UbiB family) n=1 Tax=Nocardia transvalensis TaxID=37333 RepID=A0A7W9PI84_9NOCA|nr:AarF/ABC1/UbiB kinase family protein [Nocardia transvalensis]MBB5916375.1 putative unusual protein kinase regulating ubiquinone biosynthesis (AarF/ABC1/UbiB family) [Nocardia transvalensis]
MSVRRVGDRPENERAGTGRAWGRARRSDGNPPGRKVVRNAKLAALPVAFAGRQAAGVGRRMLGRPSAEIQRDIQLRTAQHIFEVLGELKGCAAKLGQILAIYELALPPELAEPYRTALSLLQDSAPPMLPGTVHAAMAANLGEDWRDRFREFDDRRAASASIGQVHRAVWHDGRPVAVKVMYPGARAAVLSDLDELRRISALAPVFAPGADIDSLTEALASSVREELDYAAEADHQRVHADAYAGDPEFVIPRVVCQQGDVVVSEWLEGTPLPRLIASGDQDERNRAGMLVLRFVLSSWERTGLLYCDPHPGNFRVLADGRLGVVDFGACAPFPPPGFREAVAGIGEALVNGGIEELEDAIRAHGFVDPGRSFDIAALADQLEPIVEPLLRPTFRLSMRWLRKRVLRALDLRLTNVNRELTMPADYTPFARCLLTVAGVLCQLHLEGPISAEILTWSPELAEVMDRHRARTPAPTHLDDVRRRRKPAASSAEAAG